MTVLEVMLWTALGLIVYTHLGYPLVLGFLSRVVRSRRARRLPAAPPSVTLIIPAHNEEETIERRLENAGALAYDRNLLEIIVASDGSRDRTVELAQAVAERDGRMRVLELSRQGKVSAQDSAVEQAKGEILAFSDANALWEEDALELLVREFGDPDVGYVCGQLRYDAAGSTNQEGVYWRFETAVRALEGRLGSVTAGNGAIYAVRRDAYLRLDPRTSHDLALPFNLVKRGWRATYAPHARAVERSLPSVETEFRRKRRMMAHAWPTIVKGGMLDPRGYGLLYGFEIFSHRILRYATPFLHLFALAANIVLVGQGGIYVVTLAAQAVLLVGAALSPLFKGRVRALSLCRYYVLVTASIAAGLWDWLAKGTPATWERAEGRG